MTPTSMLAVHTTCATREDALRIARALVEQRLAACVQIDAVESVYRWQDAVQQEPEVRLLCKTTTACWPAVQQCIAALHRYELPAIYALPVTHASEAYAAWVTDECCSPRD